MGVVDRYELHMRRRGLRLRSVRKYRDAVAAWCGAHGERWPEVTTAELERWLDGRRHRHYGTPLAARSRYWWVSALAGFYTWAIDEGFANCNPAERAVRPKLPQLAARPLRELDAELVMTVTGPGPVRVACALMLYGGLRCGEVAGLRWRDVDEQLGRLRIVGKGGRTRWVPIGPHLVGELGRAGRAGHAGDRGDVVGGVLLDEGRAAPAVVGLEATAHQLRHTFATCSTPARPVTWRSCSEPWGMPRSTRRRSTWRCPTRRSRRPSRWSAEPRT
jgi:site-specific recombinase XerD